MKRTVIAAIIGGMIMGRTAPLVRAEDGFVRVFFYGLITAGFEF